MLNIQFEGYFQCRFATDPDPTDDPRGISGPTFAGPGEPNFDRIIRLNDFQHIRYPRKQEDGVKVNQVLVNQTAVPDHPLIGGAVNLLGYPQFHQRNLIINEVPLETLIDPFHLQISGNDITIDRVDLLDVTHPEYNYSNIFLDPTLLKRRLNTFVIQSPIVAEATGIMNYEAYRKQRAVELQHLLEKTTDPTERASLEKRINFIHKDATHTGLMIASTQFLGLMGEYTFAMNGPATVSDPCNELGGEVGFSQPWPLNFWMGGYDVDTMFGYMKGTLSIPFHPTSESGK